MKNMKRLLAQLVLTLVLVVSFIQLVRTSSKEPPTTLQVGILKRASSCPVKSKAGDTLRVHYRGTLFEGGTEFDSSLKRDPFEFTVGAGQVIPGWDRGLLDMCEGEKRKLKIPPALAYGVPGSPPTIPSNAALVFTVELIEIKSKQTPPVSFVEQDEPFSDDD